MSADHDELDEPRTAIAVRIKGFRPVVHRPHTLLVQRTNERFVLDKDEYTLGRGESVTLFLDSEEVSRAHAKLTRSDGEYEVEDLGSRNGILLNGLRIHAAVLRDGDELQLGDLVLTYREGT